ncbi:SH3 domain-containing protein [Pseudodesulfovibrio sp.]|nr:SH3 domain-containing protein [Pseudodesulfovibrio sp.]
MKRRAVILILCLITLAACSTKTPDQPILDLVTLTQDAGAYHRLPADTPLLSPEAQQKAYAHFLAEHFAPWERSAPKHTAKEVFWGLDVYGPKKIYGENTLLRDPAWMERMREYSRVAQYPSLNRRAITVTNTSMRVLPTNRPAFYDFARAGEGFPFDYMQNSLVLAGTPLYASHVSADRAWILVESRFAFGWVPVTDIAWVDDGFISIFKTGNYGAITRDDVPLTDTDGSYRFTGHVGTLLPILERLHESDGYAFIIPTRTQRGDAVPQVAYVPAEFASPAPLPTTPANFTRLANAMLGRQYGWGGLYEDRDCSAATMDLMAAFGIYLPRNSSQQIKVGAVISLKDMSREEKKRLIIQGATPFLTLVRKPGHIMLYVGEQNGQPIVFHSTWGLKTKKDGKYGRKIIGSTVITTLEPGLELDNLARPEGILLETVYAISTLPEIGGK